MYFQEAIEDLTSFCTENLAQQAVVVRELFTNVLEAKPRARKAVGHLLDAALHKNVISTEGFLSGYEKNFHKIILKFFFILSNFLVLKYLLKSYQITQLIYLLFGNILVKLSVHLSVLHHRI